MESGIYFNASEHDLKDVQVQFGGKIGVSFAHAKNDPKAIVILQEMEHLHTPGVNVVDDKYNPENFNIKLVFDNVESINVLERALNDAKLYILNKQKSV